MPDAITLVKRKKESPKEFNERLTEACREMPVSEVMLEVVDGMPVVTIMSDVREATEDDVEAGLAKKIGELISEEEKPLLALVSVVRASDEELCAKSEARLGLLYDAGNGDVVDVQFAHGEQYGWVIDGESKHWLPKKVTYAVVLIEDHEDENADDEAEDDDDEKDEGEEEEEIRKQLNTRNDNDESAEASDDDEDGDE